MSDDHRPVAPAKRRLARRPLATAGVLTATTSLAVVALAGAANAGTVKKVSPNKKLAATQTVNVTVTFTAADAYYALAECNTTYSAGTACNGSTAVGLNAVTSTGPQTIQLTVDRTFSNTSFAGPGPGGTTTCASATGGDPCAVYLSTYDGMGNHVNHDSLKKIKFKK